MNSSLVFYQASVGVFAVLIVTGVVGELRDIRTRLKEVEGPMPGPLKVQLVGIVVLLALALAGALLSLSVLLDPPPHKFQQLAVSLLLAATLVGIPLLTLGSLAEHDPKELLRLTRGPLAVLLVLLLGGALYLLAGESDEAPTTFTYHVYGTCAAGACGLNERAGPRVKSEPLGQLRDGDEVEVVCQVSGGWGEEPNGVGSKVWNKLSNGAYVNDAGIDTPPVGNGIPACE